jgi:hypothetical protein
MVDSARTAFQNYENYITLSCLEQNKTFLQYYINSEPYMAWWYSQSDWKTI